MAEPEAPRPPAKDPMKSFRGVMAGTLIVEAITVALALPIIHQLGAGATSAHGWAVVALAGAHVACCWLLRHDWIRPVILALQVVLLAFFAIQPVVGVIGLVFLAVWVYLFWLRHDVAKRMAAGTLPSQQPPEESD